MQSEANVGDLLGALRRSYRSITLAVLTGTTLICIGPLLIPPRYTAQSQILIEPQGLMAPQGSVIELPADLAAMQTEITTLTSPDLLQRVLDGLPSDKAYEAAIEPKPPADKPGSVLDEVWGRVTGWIPRAWLTAVGQPGRFSLRQFLQHLHVAQEAGSHVLAVNVTSIDPKEAAAVANLLTKYYVEGQDQQKRASTDRTLAWLAQRTPELRSQVQRLDAAVQAYRIANNLAGADPQGVSDKQIADLDQKLADAENDLATAKARADIANLKLHEEGGPASIAGMVHSQALTQLHERELTLMQAQAAANNTLSSDSLLGNRLRAELAQVRTQMGIEAQRAANNLNNEVTIATARLRAIKQQLATVRSDRADVSLSDLERDAASSHRLYENLLLRQEQLREQRESLSPGVRILSLAQPPIRPSSINPAFFIPPAAIVSFLIASFIVIIKAYRDRTLRSGRDISDVLGVPCIGLVPEVRRLRGAKPHQYLLEERFSPYAEAIRSLVASLQVTRQRHDPQVLLCTSSLPAEGKTTLAVSVAVYLAALGHRTIIVDFDLRRPSVVRELAGKRKNKLPEIVDQGSQLMGPVQRIPSLSLDFLVARPGDTTEPLRHFTSDGVTQLMANLRNDYDYIVVDTAPLLAIAESRLLASQADKVLFAVEWGKTRREAALNALGVLPERLLDEERVAAVITRVDIKKHAQYGYADSGQCFATYGQYFALTSGGAKAEKHAGWGNAS